MNTNKSHTNDMDINVSLVNHLVATQFPEWSDLLIRPVEFDGHDNRTFHLGEDMLVRLPSSEKYAQQVEKEHQWLPKLAPFLSLSIPVPLAMGVPIDDYYPWHWSIYQWLEGENVTIERIADLRQFAVTLAEFLVALQQINTAGGPLPGTHNFFRGGSLTVYDKETRQALIDLNNKIDIEAVTVVWEEAIATTWQNPPVWVHGDISVGNLLVKDGQLSAVIDFGCLAIGDPACDLSVAWTLFEGGSRSAFRTALSVDDVTWARGRGWTLWKALITLAKSYKINLPEETRKSQQIIDAILSEVN